MIEKLQSWHYYMLSVACFFITVYLLQSEEIINKKLLCNGLVFLAIAESVVCILQAIGLIPSMSRYLQVSGSWINPNVTAMFITLVLPLVLLKLMSSSARKRWAYSFMVLLLFTGLYLLKCRSAYIGAFAATAVCLYFYYDIPQKIKNRRFRIVTIAISAILLVTAIPLIKSLYLSKQASADGRLLIYKVSAFMVANKPFSGYGYGQFEKYYNLEQAAYIANGKASPAETQNAGHVNMGYNEFLQHGVEGGLPGLLFFASLLLVLLIRGYFVLQISASGGHFNDSDLCRNCSIHFNVVH
ncbi:MAG TPA: O-antigen ligase family protein [Pelobium sp.]|nr:O-antigen ligase family protein [Pelobium sp.]